MLEMITLEADIKVPEIKIQLDLMWVDYSEAKVKKDLYALLLEAGKKLEIPVAEPTDDTDKDAPASSNWVTFVAPIPMSVWVMNKTVNFAEVKQTVKGKVIVTGQYITDDKKMITALEKLGYKAK